MSVNKLIVIFAVVAATLPSSVVFAAAPQLSDSQYVAVARCDGLASSKALGAGGGATFDALVKSEGRTRVAEILDRADEARGNAMRQASHADATEKLGLIAERDGACQILAHNSGQSSASNAGSHSSSN